MRDLEIPNNRYLYKITGVYNLRQYRPASGVPSFEL